MVVDGLLIPDLLEAMLAEGRWPRNADEASKQLLHSRVPEDRNRRLRRIYLYAPPFHTIARIVASGGQDFYAASGALHELVPEASIAIADFGLGADAPILLDYRTGPSNPQVIHLEWSDHGESNFWVVMAPDFATFVDMLGLQSAKVRQTKLCTGPAMQVAESPGILSAGFPLPLLSPIRSPNPDPIRWGGLEPVAP